MNRAQQKAGFAALWPTAANGQAHALEKCEARR